MAAPLSHIFLAIQILAGPLKDHFDTTQFLIGTSFPDIRYLKCIEREETHFNGLTFNDIKNEANAFRAGMLFHSLVDEIREQYIVKNKLYEKLPNFRFISQSIKFAEDKILRSFFNFNKYSNYFDLILEEERKYKISDTNITRWHRFLKSYINQEYSTHELLMKYFDLHDPDAWFIKRLLFSWFYAKKINNTIETIIQNEEIKTLLLNFYLNFTDHLTQQHIN